VKENFLMTTNIRRWLLLLRILLSGEVRHDRNERGGKANQ